MKLRARTFLAIAATVVALLAVQYFLVRRIVEGGFDEVSTASLAGFASIEDRDTRRNVERVTDALAYRIETLATKAADWSQWDDTYKFIKDKNRAYVESNLGDDALTALKMNMLLLVDGDGAVVYSTAFDLEEEKTVPVPESLRVHLGKNGLLLSHDSPDHVTSGLLSLPEGPLMVASRPIVKSNGEGPMRGSVVFARFLDESELKQLAAITHLKIVTCYSLAGPIPEDFGKALQLLSDSEPIHVTPEGDDTIRGYTSVADVEGKKTLHLRVDIDRDIYRQGLATGRDIAEKGRFILAMIVVSLLATGVIVCLVIGATMERWVLSRLGKLADKALKIGEKHDFSLRVREDGKDEIADLAQAVNRMLEALESTHHEIEANNAEMHLLMDTIPAGLLSIDENGLVNPEHSRMAEVYFQTGELAGKKYSELLGLGADRAEDARALADFLDVLGKDLLDEDSMSALNPFPQILIEGGGPPRWLKIGYYLIRRGNGLPNHILAVVEDITEKKRLAAQISKTERENLQLKAIAEDPELFREFLAEADKILKAVATTATGLAPEEKSRPLVNEIFRGIHTIKGVADSFGLLQLAQSAGELEESLEPLRRTGDPITPTLVADINVKLKLLADCFSEASASARAIFGEDARSDGGVLLRVSSAEISRHMEHLRSLGHVPDSAEATAALLKREALVRFAALRSVPVRRGLARSLRIVPGLIDRLAKDAVFNLVGADQEIDCEVARELNVSLIHMIRNALDHGIEPPCSREEAGKPPTGTVTLHVDKAGNWLTLKLRDDGKGLDPEALRAMAAKRGILTEAEAAALSDEEALGLIFRPGFTTAQEVSDVSGRGVGMDAVRESIVSKLGGSISITSEKGLGTTFTIRVPMA